MLVSDVIYPLRISFYYMPVHFQVEIHADWHAHFRHDGLKFRIYTRWKYKIVTSDSARTTFSDVPILNLRYVVKYADNQYYLRKLFLLYVSKT